MYRWACRRPDMHRQCLWVPSHSALVNPLPPHALQAMRPVASQYPHSLVRPLLFFRLPDPLHAKHSACAPVPAHVLHISGSPLVRPLKRAAHEAAETAPPMMTSCNADGSAATRRVRRGC